MATDNLVIEIERNDVVVVEEPQVEVVQVFEYGTSGTSGALGFGSSGTSGSSGSSGTSGISGSSGTSGSGTSGSSGTSSLGITSGTSGSSGSSGTSGYGAVHTEQTWPTELMQSGNFVKPTTSSSGTAGYPSSNYLWFAGLRNFYGNQPTELIKWNIYTGVGTYFPIRMLSSGTLPAGFVLGTDGITKYWCLEDHLSDASNRPTTGVDWATYWAVPDNPTQFGSPPAWQTGVNYYTGFYRDMWGLWPVQIGNYLYCCTGDHKGEICKFDMTDNTQTFLHHVGDGDGVITFGYAGNGFLYDGTYLWATSGQPLAPSCANQLSRLDPATDTVVSHSLDPTWETKVFCWDGVQYLYCSVYVKTGAGDQKPKIIKIDTADPTFPYTEFFEFEDIGISNALVYDSELGCIFASTVTIAPFTDQSKLYKIELNGEYVAKSFTTRSVHPIAVGLNFLWGTYMSGDPALGAYCTGYTRFDRDSLAYVDYATMTNNVGNIPGSIYLDPHLPVMWNIQWSMTWPGYVAGLAFMRRQKWDTIG